MSRSYRPSLSRSHQRGSTQKKVFYVRELGREGFCEVLTTHIRHRSDTNEANVLSEHHVSKRVEVTYYSLLLGPMSGWGVNTNDDVDETLTDVAIVWRGVWRGMRRHERRQVAVRTCWMAFPT